MMPIKEEIGALIAQALAKGAKERRPWYEPSETLPDQPIINAPKDEFETLVVDMTGPRGKKPVAVVEKISTTLADCFAAFHARRACDQRNVREGRNLKARDPTWTAQQVFDHSRRNA